MSKQYRVQVALLLTIASTLLAFHAIPLVIAGPRIIHVPADYAMIQGAVNASNSGDTIIVAAGTYNETVVVVGKSLSLIGVGNGQTIIDAKQLGIGINITQATGVTVSGFTIRDTAGFSEGIMVNSSYNIVATNNIIQASLQNSGIMVSSSSNVTIDHNTIQAAPQSNGTFVISSNLVTVRANNITGNVRGIAVQSGFSNLIAGNNVTGNKIGIGIYSSQGNKVVDNVARGAQKGLELSYGSAGNVAARNIVSNNTFGVWLQSSSRNLLVDNNVDFNNVPSAALTPIGVYLSGATGNAIYYNNIRNNTLQMFGVSSGDMTGNTWNDGSPSPKGNYWSDYNGVDNDTDGVGDTQVPWPCPNGGSKCSSSNTAGVDWYPLISTWKPSPITVTAKAKPASGCPGPQGLQVNLTSSASGGISPYSFTWNFGDGNAGTGQNITRPYTTRGTFFPRITAIDNTAKANGTDLTAILVFSGGLQLHVDDQMANPVANANITSLTTPPGQSRFTIFSDGQGIGSVACLTPGIYKVQVSHTSYVSTIVQFTVANVTANANVTLASVTVPGPFPPAWVLYAGLGAGIAAGLVTFYVYSSRRRRAGLKDQNAKRS